MKKILFFIFIIASAARSFLHAETPVYCNPLNLSYRFCLEQPSRREAADPTVVLFKDNYYLFASKSGGYWYSSDLATWNFVTTADLPLENYAPTAITIGDWVYFFCSGSNTIYRSNNPTVGKWEVYNNSFPISTTDPALFVDSDGKVYFYYGCSNDSPIQAIELDVNNKLNPKGSPVGCFSGNPAEHGWEQPGDYNNKTGNPWIEGAWMNKYNGRYYLQYAGPGTEYKCYGDGVYVSENPLGPFTYAKNNPFSSKPEGFIAGAGHGSTFEDKYGNWWHIATMSISIKHMFERRLGLFPAGFDKEGNLYTRTDFGDYPISIPDHKYTDVSELIPDWNLLSYHKTAEASSSISTYPVSFAFDENVRTFWSAMSGDKGEWLSVDLGTLCSVNAVQVNFAENNTQLLGRNTRSEQYLIEYSSDKQTWNVLIDKTANKEDLTHQFSVLPVGMKARYIRITNYRAPGGTFAISDLRIFGKGANLTISGVSSVQLQRSVEDPRVVKLTWEKQMNATGYNVRFGTEPDKLYRSYEVYGDTSVTIRSLNKHQSCFFEVDAFDENRIVKGTFHSSVISIQPTIRSANPGSIVRFRTDAFSLSAAFQWQEESGNGFVDLSDRLPYVNTKTRELLIQNASTNLKNNKYRCVVTDGNISDTTNVVFFNMPITENKLVESDNSFKVFPNPAKNEITIITRLNQIGLDFYIINACGFYVLTGKIASLSTVLDINRLPAGVYLLQVRESNIKTFKV